MVPGELFAGILIVAAILILIIAIILSIWFED